MGMKVCANCGGSFDNKEPKCPYCGMINEEGAELEYNNKLEKIRKKLDIVDNIAEDDYRKSLRLFLKTFLITALISFGIFAIIWLSTNEESNARLMLSRKEMDEKIEQALWLHEATKPWNALYEEGRYEEMVVAVTSSPAGPGLLYNWEHYDLYLKYNRLLSVEKYLAEGLEKMSSYTYHHILQDSMEIRYALENRDQRYISRDYEILEDKFAEVKQEILEVLGLEEAEYDRVFEGATKLGFPDYDYLSNYAKERMGE